MEHDDDTESLGGNEDYGMDEFGMSNTIDSNEILNDRWGRQYHGRPICQRFLLKGPNGKHH